MTLVRCIPPWGKPFSSGKRVIPQTPFLKPLCFIGGDGVTMLLSVLVPKQLPAEKGLSPRPLPKTAVLVVLE